MFKSSDEHSVTESLTMFDPIASMIVIGTLAMTSVYGSYVYWTTRGLTSDEWRERKLAANRQRLRQVIREENRRASDAALVRQLVERAATLRTTPVAEKEAENESEKKYT
ncbi:hypothetical protein CSHISOI_10018 [Colletotrichum shisoi]|uniref:Uncharacterized protein n=1 Tax=Colletotrichum shisoi TaxID=2078593 RepID=A0A5Q4BES0_9PEZI|nr:hypothetical protein CSHISOI_10018 [Colletotrichum shisoi]